MFKRIFWLVFVLIFLISACSPQTNNENRRGVTDHDEEKLQVSVSILPQKWFVDRIAGEWVDSMVMVGSGDDPHSYEPSPAQMVALEKSVLYFTIGIEFEDAWMEKLSAVNQTMTIVDSAVGVERIAMIGGHHHHDNDVHDEPNEHDEQSLDPHIWFSPANAKIIARNIAEALIDYDPEHKDSYEKHLLEVLEEIDATDLSIKTLLSEKSRSHFMVVHPAWAYFAEVYDLEMIPVEIGGNEPGPEDLASLLEAVKSYEITVIFVEKGSNMNFVRTLSKQAGIYEIVEWDPMAYDWSDNMLSLAKDLKEALK